MEIFSVDANGDDNVSASQPPRNKKPRTELPPIMPSTTGTTSAANVSAAAVHESGFIREPLSEDESETPLTNGFIREPLSVDESETPLTNGFIREPLSEDESETSLTNGFIREPLSEDDSETPLGNGFIREPLSEDDSETPLTVRTSTANVSAAAAYASAVAFNVSLAEANAFANASLAEANAAAAAIQKNCFVGDLLLDENSDDMEGLGEGPNQSEGEEEPEHEWSEEEGSYDGERDEEREDREYQTDHEDEVSEEVDDINQGPVVEGGDTVSDDDVSYGNTAGSEGNKSSMIGTFTDQDVLDCPICYEALTIPVSQCENGHIACASCCFRIGHKCPSCSQRIGDIRCRPIERIINSVKFICPNLEYGCKEMMFYNKREAHGKSCIFAPCSCPLESCDYVGSEKNLYAHFRAKHSSSALQFSYKDTLEVFLDIDVDRTVIIQEETDGRLFILNHVNGPFAHAINLICIGASHPTKEFYYELSVGYENNHILTLKSNAATMKTWSVSRTLSKCLLVPFDFTHDGPIIVNICLEKRKRCL